MAIAYDLGKGRYKNWVVAETSFNSENLAKFETIFTLGNGYMGLRAATEEHYAGETRGNYIAGVFDAFPGEVTELANIPDWLGVEIYLEGERFNLNPGTVHHYCRKLNLLDGELIREVEWQSPLGRMTRLEFRRFVSMDDLHLAALQIKIVPLNYSGIIKIESGFDGQVTNSGVQHFIEGDKRVLPDGSFYITARTQESNIFLAMAARHRYYLQNEEVKPDEKFRTGRRQLFAGVEFDIQQKEEFRLEKLVTVYTGRDPEFAGQKNNDKLRQLVIEKTVENLERANRIGYLKLMERHRAGWHSLWQEMDIQMDGPDFDQLAVRFAQFHLLQMTPGHDTRLSVAAKGLSGEGYKGHVFWDTEIFILPFFIYTFPSIARRLLIYRYHTLEGARKKAREKGYRGAMYAWESALTGEETTPKYWGLDNKTGKPIRIWCGDLEQHISSDVAYAVWHYFQATGDSDFMYKYGAEIILDTARFWASRVNYNREEDRYEIHDVIGPDEYSEHVNNNAFTNYMIKWHLEKAVEIVDWLKQDREKVWKKLSLRLKITEDELLDWKHIAEKMYTHLDEENGLISQYDGFMDKKEIDLSPYQGKVGAIMEVLSREEISKYQVLKQADVVMLLYLLGEEFDTKVKKINLDFYEPKTLHDSSLSPGIHAILAAETQDLEKAYEYFKRGTRIDLGEEMKSSDAGLHAASLGAIWQMVVNGFAGLKIINGRLKIEPKLPLEWKGLKFSIYWKGKKYQVSIDRNGVKINERLQNQVN